MNPIVETGGTLTEARVAVFDEDKLYRFILNIVWDRALPRLVCVLLNPSRADQNVNDPTVTRMCVRAVALGCGGLIVLNAFAWRETDRLKMLKVDDPVGELNDHHILTTLRAAKANGWTVVVGWGNEGGHRGRSGRVARLLRQAGVEAVCLRYCANGEPGHPLYVGYDEPFKPWPRPPAP